MPCLVVATTHRGAGQPRRDAIRHAGDHDLPMGDPSAIGQGERVGDHLSVEGVAVSDALDQLAEQHSCRPAVAVVEAGSSGRHLAGISAQDRIDAGLSRADPLSAIDTQGAFVGCCFGVAMIVSPTDPRRVQGKSKEGRGSQGYAIPPPV